MCIRAGAGVTNLRFHMLHLAVCFVNCLHLLKKNIKFSKTFPLILVLSSLSSSLLVPHPVSCFLLKMIHFDLFDFLKPIYLFELYNLVSVHYIVVLRKYIKMLVEVESSVYEFLLMTGKVHFSLVN